MLARGLNRTHGEGLPPPSAELAILAALVHAHLKTLSAKKRRMFLDSVEATVREHEALENVTRIRSTPQDEATTKARREAIAWLRMARIVFETIEREEDVW